MQANLSTDPRILAGMKRQLALRAARIGDGARHLGWKAGFGAPAALRTFGIDGPLMGFLLQSSTLDSGATVSLKGWTKPVAEPEIAVHLGADLAGGTDAEAAGAAITALGPAIELADLDQPPEDVASILAGNIYHRHVILGPADTRFAGGRADGLAGWLERGGETTEVVDLQANTGRLVDIVAHLANTLAACGERLRAGDIIIAGSVTPPLMLSRSDRRVGFKLAPVGSISVDLSFD